MKYNQSGPGFELVSPCPYPATITITPRTPPLHFGHLQSEQSDGEVPVMLEVWGMKSTPSLPSLPGSLWPGVVAPDKVPIYG